MTTLMLGGQAPRNARRSLTPRVRAPSSPPPSPPPPGWLAGYFFFLFNLFRQADGGNLGRVVVKIGQPHTRRDSRLLTKREPSASSFG